MGPPAGKHGPAALQNCRQTGAGVQWPRYCSTTAALQAGGPALQSDFLPAGPALLQVSDSSLSLPHPATGPAATTFHRNSQQHTVPSPPSTCKVICHLFQIHPQLPLSADFHCPVFPRQSGPWTRQPDKTARLPSPRVPHRQSFDIPVFVVCSPGRPAGRGI